MFHWAPLVGSSTGRIQKPRVMLAQIWGLGLTAMVRSWVQGVRRTRVLADRNEDARMKRWRACSKCTCRQSTLTRVWGVVSARAHCARAMGPRYDFPHTPTRCCCSTALSRRSCLMRGMYKPIAAAAAAPPLLLLLCQ